MGSIAWPSVAPPQQVTLSHPIDQVLNCCTVDPGCTPDTFHDCSMVHTQTNEEYFGSDSDLQATPAMMSDLNFSIDSGKLH